MKKLLLYFSFFVIHLSFLSAQNTEINSLRAVLKLEKEDTNKVNALNSLSFALYTIKPDSTILLAQRASALAIKLGWTKGAGTAFNNLGVGYWAEGNYMEALDNHIKALKIAQELKDKKMEARSYSNIGLVYLDEGDYSNALGYDIKALKISDELGDKKGQEVEYGNIALIYNDILNYPQALEYYTNALKLANEMGNRQFQADDLNGIGQAYLNEGDYNKALQYDTAALKISQELGDRQDMAVNLANIGSVYKHLGKYSKSLDYFSHALKLSGESGDKSMIAKDHGSIGFLYIQLKDYAVAEENLKEAIALDSTIGEKTDLMGFEEYLSQLYETMGQYKLAMTWYKKSMELKDALFNVAKDRDLTRKQLTYDFEKKEAMAKAEQEKKDVLIEADKRRRTIITWAVVGCLLLTLAFMAIIFRSLSLTRKQKRLIEIKNKETERQKSLVEEKQEQIMDSINYAKRIQSSILASSGKPDTDSTMFILFKPKDIVSGDFYWLSHKGEESFIITADCTGHGVPGAFLTMIGSTLLNEIINHDNITEPGEIITALAKGVASTLSFKGKEDEISTDGMDISVCKVNHQTGKIFMAAVNHNIYVANIKEGVKLIEPQISSAHGIFAISTNTNIKTIELKPEKDSMIYMPSDGYEDQLGGPLKKKFLRTRFSDLLNTIYHLTPEDQKQRLEQEFNNWKGSMKQVDDVTIVGFRI